MNKNKKERAVYDRKLVRKILKSRLGTNKIRSVFHDKSQLKAFFKNI